MSSFRCPFYYYDGGKWRCTRVSSALSSYDFDTYCTDEYKYVQCPYYRNQKNKKGTMAKKVYEVIDY